MFDLFLIKYFVDLTIQDDKKKHLKVNIKAIDLIYSNCSCLFANISSLMRQVFVDRKSLIENVYICHAFNLYIMLIRTY